MSFLCNIKNNMHCNFSPFSVVQGGSIFSGFWSARIHHSLLSLFTNVYVGSLVWGGLLWVGCCLPEWNSTFFSRSKHSLYCSLAYSRWPILVFPVFRFVNMLDVNHWTQVKDNRGLQWMQQLDSAIRFLSNTRVTCSGWQTAVQHKSNCSMFIRMTNCFSAQSFLSNSEAFEVVICSG